MEIKVLKMILTLYLFYSLYTYLIKMYKLTIISATQEVEI